MYRCFVNIICKTIIHFEIDFWEFMNIKNRLQVGYQATSALPNEYSCTSLRFSRIDKFLWKGRGECVTCGGRCETQMPVCLERSAYSAGCNWSKPENQPTRAVSLHSSRNTSDLRGLRQNISFYRLIFRIKQELFVNTAYKTSL